MTEDFSIILLTALACRYAFPTSAGAYVDGIDEAGADWPALPRH